MRSMYLGIAFLLMTSGHAFGASATWFVEGELAGGSFGGAGTFSGSFDYDDASSTFSNIDIEAVATNSDTIFFDDGDVSVFTDPGRLDLVDGFSDLGGTGLLGQAVLSINFGGPLDPLASPIAIVPISVLGECSSSDCSLAFGDDIVGSATVVPLPAAAWLFGSALLGLGLVKRRQA